MLEKVKVAYNATAKKLLGYRETKSKVLDQCEQLERNTAKEETKEEG